MLYLFFFFFSSRRRHTRLTCDWSSDVCSSDLERRASATRRGSRGSGRSSDRARRRAGSEERRVGKECRSRWSPYHYKKKRTMSYLLGALDGITRQYRKMYQHTMTV